MHINSNECHSAFFSLESTFLSSKISSGGINSKMEVFEIWNGTYSSPSEEKGKLQYTKKKCQDNNIDGRRQKKKKKARKRM